MDIHPDGDWSIGSTASDLCIVSVPPLACDPSSLEGLVMHLGGINAYACPDLRHLPGSLQLCSVSWVVSEKNT